MGGDMTDTNTQGRKVGLLLGTGIFLLPIVFAWFTLRRGHSRRSRVVAFAWLAFILVAYAVGSGPTETPAAPEQKEAMTAEQVAEKALADLRASYDRSPEKALALESVRGEISGFGTVLIIGGTITNDAEFDIKDPTIWCDLFGPSGTKVGATRATLYEIVPANGSKRFAELNMGFTRSSQVSNYTCNIMSAVKL